jgi:hypothetical protein
MQLFSLNRQIFSRFMQVFGFGHNKSQVHHVLHGEKGEVLVSMHPDQSVLVPRPCRNGMQ